MVWLRSVYASVYGPRLAATMPDGVPGRVAAIAHQSVGAAYVAAGKIAGLGHPVLGQPLQHASANAFLRGLTIGCITAATPRSAAFHCSPVIRRAMPAAVVELSPGTGDPLTGHISALAVQPGQEVFPGQLRHRDPGQ